MLNLLMKYIDSKILKKYLESNISEITDLVKDDKLTFSELLKGDTPDVSNMVAVIARASIIQRCFTENKDLDKIVIENKHLYLNELRIYLTRIKYIIEHAFTQSLITRSILRCVYNDADKVLGKVLKT